MVALVRIEMIRLRIREAAEAKEIKVTPLSYESKVSLTTMRRYWFGTKNGKIAGERLEAIDLVVLERIANALGVKPLDLLFDEETKDAPTHSK